jgi:hypothetical protein
MEIITAGSRAYGISMHMAPGTQAGTVVRAILMDGNFSLVDTSFRHVVSEDDLELIWGSAPLYLSLTTAPELPIGDYFVGTQQLGTTGQLNVTVGGDAPIGRSVLMEGTSFTLNYLYSTPRVRLHLGELAVGIPHPNVPLLGGMSMHPVPARDRTHLQFEQIRTGPVNVLVHDQAGRAVKHMAVGDLPPGEHRLTLMVEDLQPGWYMVTLTTPTGPRTGKLIVAH